MENGTNRTGMPTAAGILLILSALISLPFWLVFGFFFGAIGAGMSMIPGFGGAGGLLMICSTIGIIISIVVLLGGVFALKRSHWGFTLIGSIFGLFTIGFYISSILSLIALILLIVSKNEFNSARMQTTHTNQTNTSDRRCPNCGRVIPMDANVCPYCGKKFEEFS